MLFSGDQFFLADSADPDEMSHFNLDLYCLPKYPFKAFWSTKDYANEYFSNCCFSGQSNYIVVYFLECNQTCGGNVSDVSQYFSPLDCDVDGWYDFNLQCTWTITVENHQKVRLIISNVDLQEEDEDNYECIYDYIRVIFFYFSLTVKVAPRECVIRSGQP